MINPCNIPPSSAIDAAFLADARRAFMALASRSEVKYVNAIGLGNNPAFIRLFKLIHDAALTESHDSCIPSSREDTHADAGSLCERVPKRSQRHGSGAACRV